MKKTGLLVGLLCLAGLASAEITLVKSGENYRIDVPAGTLNATGTLTLVWDTSDKGNTLSDWTNSREVSTTLDKNGGTFTTPVEGVTEGSVVRAFATYSVQTLKTKSAYISLRDNQYIDTGCAENAAYGISTAFNVQAQYNGNKYASIMSGTIDQFTLGCGGSLNNFYLRYANQDTGVRPALTANKDGGNTVVIKDKKFTVNGTLQTWNSGKSSVYNSATLSSRTGTINLSSDYGHTRFSGTDFYYLYIYGANNIRLRDMWPVKIGDTAGFWEWTEGRFYTGSGTTGTITATGDVSSTDTRVVAVSPVAVDCATYVVTATWTGTAADRDPTNPANWDCRDADGNVIADALPTADTAVTLSGTIDIDFPAGYTLPARSITMNATLGSDCTWLGAFQPAAVGEQLSYVQVHPGAYVDTGFYPNAQTRAVLDVTVSANKTREYWFGAWNSAYNRGAFCFCNDGSGLYTGWGNNGGGNGSYIPKGRHTLELDKGAVKIDGATRNTYSNNGGFPVNYPIFLFAQNRAGTAYHGDSQAIITFHEFKLYDNGTLVRDYVPMRRFADGKVGLYEKVSGAFVSWLNYSRNSEGYLNYGYPVGTLVRPGSVDSALPAGATLDVAGHTLTWTPGVTTTLDAATVTSSVADGTLALNLAENTAFTNSQISLTGSLKVEKQGAGTFAAAKNYTSYTGGTDIQAGTVVTMSKPAELPFGGKQTTANAQVSIRTGATLDLNGYGAWGWHALKLDGGVLTGSTGQANFELELLADSAINATGDFGSVAYGSICPTMNGHTLTLDVALGKTLTLRGATGSGTIVAKTGGTVATHQAFADADLTLDVRDAALKLDHAIVAKDYSSTYSLAYNAGTGTVTVVGTFAPTSASFTGVQLADGATLDLRSWTTTFDTATQGTGDANGAVLFSDDATVTIDLRGRTPTLGDQIVAWSAQPANLATLTFQWDEETAANGVAVIANAQGIFYGADPNSTEVVTARWTGAAGDGDVANAANWECQNLAGRTVADAVPGDCADITITGDVNLNFAAGTTLAGRTLAVNCKLTADADWRGTFTRTAHAAEYLFLAEGAYFNTTFCPNQNTRVVLDVTVQSYPEYWCGTWNTNYCTGAYALCNDTASSMYTAFGNSGGTSGTGPSRGARHTIENDKGAIKIDGTTVMTRTMIDFQCLHPLFIGAQDRRGQARPNSPNGMYLHGVKIYDDGTLVRDYIPLRFDDGTGAFYDKVAQKVLWPSLGSATIESQSLNESWMAVTPKSGAVTAGPQVGTDEYAVASAPVFADGSQIDLNGHALTLSGGVPPSGTVTITDTSAGTPGVFTLDVPADYVFWNSRLALTGNLAFKKTGVGVFGSVLPLTYTGGTEVSVGIYRYNGGTYANSTTGFVPGATPAGDESSTVTIKTGAQLDLWAHEKLGYTYAIEGVGPNEKGALVSTRDYYNYWQHDVLHDVVLTGDATIGTMAEFSKRTLALAGHTLTFTKNDVFFADSTFTGAGTIVADLGAGKIEPYDWEKSDDYVGGFTAEEAAFEVRSGTQLSMKGYATVKDFTMAGSLWRDANDARRKNYCVNVLGRYTPVSATQPPVRFVGTAGVLDLSEQTIPWDASLLFAPGEGTNAVATVELGANTLANGAKVLSWTEAPARLSFRPTTQGAGVFTAKEDGLYYYSGLLIIIK